MSAKDLTLTDEQIMNRQKECVQYPFSAEFPVGNIQSPEVINIIKMIKEIQKRMKDIDVRKLQYAEVYDKLSYEFNTFFERYTGIFIKVVRGENLSTLASALYYRDKMLQGMISEEELSDKLANAYLPPELKAQSDAKLKEMKEQGKL